MAHYKNIIWMLFFTSISIIGIGQENKFNSMFSLSSSPSIPIGNFGSKNAANINAGFAKFGSGAQLYFSHDLSKKIGLCAMAFLSSYPLDNSAFLSTFQMPGGYQFAINSTRWRVVSYTVGAYDLYSLKKSDKGTISFYDRALIGIANGQSSGISVSGSNGSSSIQVDQPAKNSSAFCYMIGVGVRFNSSKRFSLAYALDLFSTKMTFADVTTTTNNNGSITKKQSTISQQITSLPVSVSFGYRLW